MFSKFFIERPILSNIIALFMILLGAIAVLGLPVAQYPEITPPTVQVTTTYPGASAATVAETIALPIEEVVNGVENMIYMQSTSTNAGTYALTVTFAVGTNPDTAQVLVQNRVSTALARLPSSVQAQGVTTRKQSSSILQLLALTSADDRYDGLYLSNYAVINLKDELSRLPGVGSVSILGSGDYAMRIWLDPHLLLVRGLTADDVSAAVSSQSKDVGAGQLGSPPAPKGQPFQLTVNVPGRLADAKQFEDIIVKVEPGAGGRVTRLRDVGRVELGAKTYTTVSEFDNRPTALIAVYQLPGANALDVARQVSGAMERLSKRFPEAMQYKLAVDTTSFVNASVHEVYKTLIEAGILVLIVILVFLQDWRAVLIPMTTIPVTIVGAFAVMAAMGFSVNTLTLFALVLAIGIVVDDAIVVVEGAAHELEKGKSPKDAAIQAMKDLFGPIIGITLVLMAVFLPTAFLPGITGELYRQFALVIAATALLSAVNAATLKPTQCALWMRPPSGRKNAFFRGFNRVFGAVEHRYTGLVRGMVRRPVSMSLLALAIMAAAGYGLSRVPTGFLPPEDQGYLMIGVNLPDGASLERTAAVMERVTEIARSAPGVDHVIAASGISILDNMANLANAGVAWVVMKDWSERKTAESVFPGMIFSLQEKLAAVQDGATFVLVPPPIQGVGNAAGFTMMVQLLDGSFDYQRLESLTRAVTANALTQSAVRFANTPFRAEAPQRLIEVDRIKAEALQVKVGDVFSTMQALLGSSYIGQITKFGRIFQVYVQADQNFRSRVEDLRNYNVRSATGEMIPLGTLVTVKETVGPSLVTLYNMRPAATIIGMQGEGFSSGQALAVLEQAAAKTLPESAGYQWTAISYQEKLVGNQQYLVFALAILMVYMVLAGQYESWTTPAAVILSVPLALTGVVAALQGLGVPNNIYVQIGLVLLIALAAKNAILIVEVARELRAHSGFSIADAAIEASRRRFRPILMTSFAFILGVVPLVTASGAGAFARKSLGISVFSGMLASTCIAILFVPCLYVVLQTVDEALRKKESPALSPSTTEAAG